jgi:dTDP-4-amino-4,6-dideoxygalactose transaminase
MKKILIYKPSLPKLIQYERQLDNIWKSRKISNFAYYATKLENISKKYIGTNNIISITNADMGLILSLSVLDLPKGSEIILPSFTFNSTANAVLWNGLKPVFADINKNTFCIDPDDVEKKITKKTKAILGTHIFGNACDVDKLKEISSRNKLTLIFDAAHGYGAKYKNRRVGTLGDIEVFSLSGTKVVTSAEGGLIATNDNELMQKLMLARNYGYKTDYNSLALGMNGKISELNAALGCLTLPKIDKYVYLRNIIAKKYIEELSCIKDISFQEVPDYNLSTYKDFAILTDKRNELSEFLNHKGIETKKYFYPIHLMSYYSEYANQKLPNTEGVYNKILCLPIHNDYALNKDFYKVTDAIKQFYNL